MDNPIYERKITFFEKGKQSREENDFLSVESPLELIIEHGSVSERRRTPLVLLMRTPGHDYELALGFLFTEGIIQKKDDVIHCEELVFTQIEQEDIKRMLIYLSPGIEFNPGAVQRNFLSTGSCGVCGKLTFSQIHLDTTLAWHKQKWESSKLFKWYDLLENMPGNHQLTGSMHASLLLDENGHILYCREDAGRHNALDKIIGKALQDSRIPFSQHALILSGRISFELVQKASRAGISLIYAKGAPTSAAVQLAAKEDICLVGFAKPNRFNIYTGKDRII